MIYITIINEINAELSRALDKFPTWPTDPVHAGNVVAEEAGELSKAILQRVYEPHKSSTNDVRSEAIQTAAMAIRFLISLERYEWSQCEQHNQDLGFKIEEKLDITKEFAELVNAGIAFRCTAIVDDDFCMYRDRFDNLLMRSKKVLESK